MDAYANRVIETSSNTPGATGTVSVSLSGTSPTMTFPGAGTSAGRLFDDMYASADTVPSVHIFQTNSPGLWCSARATFTTGSPDTLTFVAADVRDGSAGAGVLVTFTGTVTCVCEPDALMVLPHAGAMIRSVAATSVASSTFTKVALTHTPLYDTHGAADVTNSKIIVPTWARYVSITGHLTFAAQATAAKVCSVHLFRNVSGDPTLDYPDGDVPTPDARYHARLPYPLTTAPEYISVAAVTGWIPVLSPGEIWALYAWQNTGAAQNTGGSIENWLNIEFKP
jgi:hypothetical protein